MSLAFSHQVYGSLLRQPWETNIAGMEDFVYFFKEFIFLSAYGQMACPQKLALISRSVSQHLESPSQWFKMTSLYLGISSILVFSTPPTPAVSPTHCVCSTSPARREGPGGQIYFLQLFGSCLRTEHSALCIIFHPCDILWIL